MFNWRLVIAVAGIYTCYLLLGYVQEALVARGHFHHVAFLLAWQGIVASMTAYIGKYK